MSAVDLPATRMSFAKSLSPDAARRKAIVFTVFCALVSAVRVLYSSPSPATLPCDLFYLTLLFNTFFSVRLFASVQPVDDTKQNMIDAILAVIYLWMAYEIGHATQFLLICVVMFAVSLMKYAMLMEEIPYLRLLRHKILANSVGVLGATAALGGTLVWKEHWMAWAWASGFLIAQVDIFFLHPLYTLHDGAKEATERLAVPCC